MSESTITIVGSGIVGATLAYLLTKQGYQVTVFEKGPVYPYPHVPQFQEQVHFGYDNPAYRLPVDLKNHTLSGAYSGELEVERYMVTGGSATRWEGITPRMRPQDFKTQSEFGFGVDWPLTYEDLEPYYSRAEALLGVSGTDADNPFAPPRSQAYPLPPFELTYDDQILAERLRRQDILLHTTPQARTRLPYEDRAGCANFGTCVFCPIGARYSPMHHLQQAIATGRCQLLTNVSVRRIVTDPSGRARSLIFQENETATEQEHAAQIIIVAAGALESARLLLLSKDDRNPDGLGNQNGQVGQHLIFHHLWGMRLHYPDRLYPERLGGWGGQIHQFLDPDTRGKHGGIKIEFSSRLGYFGNPADMLGWHSGADVVKSLEPRLHWRWSAFHAESVPSPEKYVTLSTELDRLGDPFVHVHYQSTDFDYETHRFATTLFERLQQASGADDGEVRQRDEFTSGAHHLGTCRMGETAADSVVNSFGQVHDHPNLFVVGGSNFAGTTAINPTLTMVVLALRAGDFMVDQIL